MALILVAQHLNHDVALLAYLEKLHLTQDYDGVLGRNVLDGDTHVTL